MINLRSVVDELLPGLYGHLSHCDRSVIEHAFLAHDKDAIFLDVRIKLFNREEIENGSYKRLWTPRVRAILDAIASAKHRAKPLLAIVRKSTK